jgi:23S rRNA pseudouridine1911/1915/1917 synthase
VSQDRPFRRIVVSEESAGVRADKWLSLRFSRMSRTEAARHLKQGLVTSEWRPIKGSSPLQAGEPLRITIPGYAPHGAPPPLPTVLFEDARVLAVDKPAGLLAHPAGDLFVWAVVGLAKAARPDDKIDLVHRLDRDTSGVMVLTKDHDANVILKERFKARARDLCKEYLAVVKGTVGWDERVVDAPITERSDSRVRLRRGVVEGGASARTTFTVMKRMSTGLSLVRCRLHTGRTHQIRVHLEHVGHPLVGDRLYGHPDEVFLSWLDDGETDAVRARVGFPRHCLHAWRLRLPHPDGGTVDLEAPLPADMQSLVDGATPAWPAEDP